MRNPLIFGIFMLAATNAAAIDRINAGALRCEAIKSRISGDRQAILHYSGSNPGLYDRVVAGTSNCDLGEEAVGSRFHSSDIQDCQVNICKAYPGRGRR